jgi:hypothetical protein
MTRLDPPLLCETRLIRGMLYGVLFSLPLWVLIAWSLRLLSHATV